MTAGAFLVVFAAGAGALAVWVDVRFPRLAPDSIRAALVHVGASIALAQLLVLPALHTLVGLGRLLPALVGVCGVALPALAYCLLGALWMMKILRGALRGAAG